MNPSARGSWSLAIVLLAAVGCGGRTTLDLADVPGARPSLDSGNGGFFTDDAGNGPGNVGAPPGSGGGSPGTGPPPNADAGIMPGGGTADAGEPGRGLTCGTSECDTSTE